MLSVNCCSRVYLFAQWLCIYQAAVSTHKGNS